MPSGYYEATHIRHSLHFQTDTPNTSNHTILFIRGATICSSVTVLPASPILQTVKRKLKNSFKLIYFQLQFGGVRNLCFTDNILVSLIQTSPLPQHSITTPSFSTSCQISSLSHLTSHLFPSLIYTSLINKIHPTLGAC